jgi:YesN/AraC family two-component response regulator
MPFSRFKANNGEVALAIIHNENVALVISDIEMPIMDESHSAKNTS